MHQVGVALVEFLVDGVKFFMAFVGLRVRFNRAGILNPSLNVGGGFLLHLVGAVFIARATTSST